MKLLNDIINDLVDSEKSLANGLMKAKVLASQINNELLETWVDKELKGYNLDQDLPDYRQTTGEFKGSFLNGSMHYENQTISVAHLPKHQYKDFKSIFILDSVAAIESVVEDRERKYVISVGAERKILIQNSIIKLGNPRYQLLSIHLELSPTFNINILSIVRNRLLDFILAIQKEFGLEPNIENLKLNTNTINHIMNTTINNTGDGNILNTGNKAKIEANITITKGNKSQLEETLKHHGVPQESINELLSFIDKEEPTEAGKYGPLVAGWFTKLIGKAIDGSWQIAVGTAGGVLAEVLNKHYGLG